jgi:AcrR family transcriptional regulator
MTDALDGSGARPRFSRPDVVAAGVRITAERGLPGLTLSAVADRLGVQRPSLYHHFPGGFEELRAAVLESITGLEPAEDDGAAGDAGLLAWEERALRRMASASSEFPGVVPYLSTEGRNERRPLAESDRLARLLMSQDLDTSAAEAFVITNAYLVGWIMAQRQDADAAEAAGMSALATVLREAAGLDPEKVLMNGFRALLAGLGADVARNGTGPRDEDGAT